MEGHVVQCKTIFLLGKAALIKPLSKEPECQELLPSKRLRVYTPLDSAGKVVEQSAPAPLAF